MKLILSLLIFFHSFSLIAQSPTASTANDLKIIKSFIHDLANDTIKTDIILSQHIIVENSDDELYDYLEVSLEEVRINLLSKKINEIQYIPYADMPRKDVRDIDLESLDSNRIYFLHYKNRQMLAVYLEQDKIASFTLVSKSENKAHFILY